MHLLAKLGSLALAVSITFSLIYGLHERYVTGLLSEFPVFLIMLGVAGSLWGYLFFVERGSLLTFVSRMGSRVTGSVKLGSAQRRMQSDRMESEHLGDFERMLAAKLEEKVQANSRAVQSIIRNELAKALGTWKHHSVRLPVPQEVLVPAKGSIFYEFTLEVTGKSDVRVKGEIRVKGVHEGIRFLVFHESSFLSSSMRSRENALYRAPMALAYSFDVPVTHSGKYYLVFDNTVSDGEAKTINVQARVDYRLLAAIEVADQPSMQQAASSAL